MAAAENSFLIEAATYLGAASVAVPLFNRLKLGSLLGYLAAGVIVGPYGFGVVEMQEGVFHVAELGVVLFLFVIGLELSLARLWALRRDIFGLGAAQMAITGVVIGAALTAVNVFPPAAAIVAGFALAFSSTAFALQFMRDRGELNTSYGSRAFPVLLFQDLAVAPLLAVIPFLGTGGAGAGEPAGFADALKVAGVVAGLFAVGKYVLNPAFRIVASSGSREAFAAAALFVVSGVALAVSWAGLSMALGAFLAGVLLAESAYRHQIETDIEPFRGLLLGLFFISIGMGLDFAIIAEYWRAVIGGALALMVLKATILYVLARLFRASGSDALRVGAVLSQAGEFGFVVFSLGAGAGLFTAVQGTVLSAIITVSMILTPAASALAARAVSGGDSDEGGLEGPRRDEGHVLVAGFGRMGQIISQVLQNSGVAITAIDKDPRHIRNAERFGFKVYFGDAARLDVLIHAGALDAKAVVLCMDDSDAVNHAIKALREQSATLTILAVAHDRMHEIEMQSLDVDVIVRETLESSLLIARRALEGFGFDESVIDGIIQEFRKRDRDRLLAQVDAGADAGKDLLHKPFRVLAKGGDD